MQPQFFKTQTQVRMAGKIRNSLTNRPAGVILSTSSYQTVDAEITAMMPSQRACGAESQVRNTSSNGPLRAQSKAQCAEYSATWGIRQLPGICWYSAEGTAKAVKSRWHRG